ncbi:MAG TPA: hypothetical protein VKU00_03920 [Chthonomonadaceae bacterium]|nr:hypothetical protein [Chthonomonadaceae bacterium]
MLENETEDVIEGLEPGQLARFIETMTPEQRAMWTPIRKVWKRQVSQARQQRGEAIGMSCTTHCSGPWGGWMRAR